ncbi:MAG: DUF1688 family protein [Lautropia sp.]
MAAPEPAGRDESAGSGAGPQASSSVEPSQLAQALERLRSTRTIRERCERILGRVAAGDSRWFRLDADAMAVAIDRVARLSIERFPDLRLPYHSRWRHFEAIGVDRHTPLRRRMLARAGGDAARVARATLDLAVISVLLDAGAGERWRFTDPSSSASIGRSEGLALASLHAFDAGLFSSDPHWPWQVDAAALERVDAPRLAAAFQVSTVNPLVGLEGRAGLVAALAGALRARPDCFGDPARPGAIFDVLASGGCTRIDARAILAVVLEGFSPIWPTGQRIGAHPLGDCWPHPFATPPGDARVDAGRVPFHKLSQWMTYSLLEPFEWAGIGVDGIDALTGLPEYRNGGLLIDTGVLVPSADVLARQPLPVDDEAVVEWRACTVALLDRLAEGVRAEIGARTGLRGQAAALPLAAILEGGTWAAGRAIAQERRGGAPPLAVRIDGTVF